jgi:hypothetical protein
MPAQTAAAPHVVELNDAVEWLQAALDDLNAGNMAGAIYDCRGGLEHARDALDEMIRTVPAAGRTTKRGA